MHTDFAAQEGSHSTDHENKRVQDAGVIKRCPHSSLEAFIFYHTLVSDKNTNIKQTYGTLKKKKKKKKFRALLLII